jgi:hypothetical protein
MEIVREDSHSRLLRRSLRKRRGYEFSSSFCAAASVEMIAAGSKAVGAQAGGQVGICVEVSLFVIVLRRDDRKGRPEGTASLRGPGRLPNQIVKGDIVAMVKGEKCAKFGRFKDRGVEVVF